MNKLVTLPSGNTINLEGFSRAVPMFGDSYIIEWPHPMDDEGTPYYLKFSGDDADALRRYIEGLAYAAT